MVHADLPVTKADVPEHAIDSQRREHLGKVKRRDTFGKRERGRLYRVGFLDAIGRLQSAAVMLSVVM